MHEERKEGLIEWMDQYLEELACLKEHYPDYTPSTLANALILEAIDRLIGAVNDIERL